MSVSSRCQKKKKTLQRQLKIVLTMFQGRNWDVPNVTEIFIRTCLGLFRIRTSLFPSRIFSLFATCQEQADFDS